MLGGQPCLNDTFAMNIQYRKDSADGNADGLSRKTRPKCKCENCPDCGQG